PLQQRGAGLSLLAEGLQMTVDYIKRKLRHLQKEPTMFEEAGKPRSSDWGTFSERHTDAAAVDAHNAASLFREWCRAVGLSQDEITRIVSETAVDEQIAASTAIRSPLRGGVRARWKWRTSPRMERPPPLF